MSAYVAESVLKVCPTAADPKLCVMDFAPVIQEAKVVDAREAKFRHRYPDPKFGSVAVMQAHAETNHQWMQVTAKHRTAPK